MKSRNFAGRVMRRKMLTDLNAADPRAVTLILQGGRPQGIYSHMSTPNDAYIQIYSALTLVTSKRMPQAGRRT